jgi:isopentenyl-diphosphate delta-isomerase
LKKKKMMGQSSNRSPQELPAEDPEQLKWMAEDMCISVDPEDRELGPVSKRDCHLMANIQATQILHRAFSVFLFSPDGRLLLQQRSQQKITFPNAFTNTCCSHPLFTADERDLEDQRGPRQAVIRKLEHELGIPLGSVDPLKLEYLTRIHYLAPSNGKWGEHESIAFC